METAETIIEQYAKGYSDKTRIYFTEHVLYTFNAAKGKKTPFQLFPRQKAFMKSLAENKASIAIKPRQAGITTVSAAWITGQIAYADEDSPETVLCIGNKLDLANQMVTKIRDFLLQVPRWYWGDEYYSPDPKAEVNKKSIFVKDSKSELELFNGCHVYARSSGENAARGISAVSILIFDEAAFIENAMSVYSSAVAATSSVPNAKIIMVSTPNGRDPLYYNTYRQALAKENNYNAVEFRWYQDPRYNKFLEWRKKNPETGEEEVIKEPTLNKEGDIRYDEERWNEMLHKGYTPRSPWYFTMCQQFNNDSVKIAQELDVSFVGSSDNVVAPEFIDMHERLNVREPLEEMKDPLVEETWFWKPPIDGHRYICACLPEGEQVITQRGLVNVEDVKADDLLVTKEGDFTPIKHRKYRVVEDEDIVEIKLAGIPTTLKVTWNHPIWSSLDSKYKVIGRRRHGIYIDRWRYLNHNFDYHNASDLDVGSWIEIPNHYFLNPISEKEMMAIWENGYEKSRVGKYDIECPLFDEDFWWYCGMWLAEGCIRANGYSLQTTYNANETEYQNKIKETIKRLFNREVNLRKRKNSNAVDALFCCKPLGSFLLKNFGHYAHGKHIADWVKRIPMRYKLNLVLGYLDGDGHYERNGSIVASSISQNLMIDIQDILLSCGISCTIGKINHKSNDLYKGKPVNRKTAYGLKLSLHNANKLRKFLSIPITNDDGLNDNHKFKMYISKNYNKIFAKIESISIYKYSGKVYNFETTSESHSFCMKYLPTHNCDPSRGSSTDKTSIEIIDMDGVDENGLPIIEQVCEYNGKMLGDDVGELLYNYATLYNNAFVVVDATNGLGDTPLFVLLHKGYKNIYYDDPQLKKYTATFNQTNYSAAHDGVMPGFHMQGNRYPVFGGFANAVRNNEIKIRSIRVINELNTWIFKGETKRMDHMDGSNDDNLCALGMALFIMKYSYNKLEEQKNKDKAILNAYIMGHTSQGVRRSEPTNGILPKNGLPFYKDKSIINPNVGVNGNFMWLFSGYR